MLLAALAAQAAVGVAVAIMVTTDQVTYPRLIIASILGGVVGLGRGAGVPGDHADAGADPCPAQRGGAQLAAVQHQPCGRPDRGRIPDRRHRCRHGLLAQRGVVPRSDGRHLVARRTTRTRTDLGPLGRRRHRRRGPLRRRRPTDPRRAHRRRRQCAAHLPDLLRRSGPRDPGPRPRRRRVRRAGRIVRAGRDPGRYPDAAGPRAPLRTDRVDGRRRLQRRVARHRHRAGLARRPGRHVRHRRGLHQHHHQRVELAADPARRPGTRSGDVAVDDDLRIARPVGHHRVRRGRRHRRHPDGLRHRRGAHGELPGVHDGAARLRRARPATRDDTAADAGRTDGPHPYCDVAIVGIANTRQARRIDGATVHSLLVEAVEGACADAGIDVGRRSTGSSARARPSWPTTSVSGRSPGCSPTSASPPCATPRT